jgi:hypothetical protein
MPILRTFKTKEEAQGAADSLAGAASGALGTLIAPAQESGGLLEAIINLLGLKKAPSNPADALLRQHVTPPTLPAEFQPVGAEDAFNAARPKAPSPNPMEGVYQELLKNKGKASRIKP